MDIDCNIDKMIKNLSVLVGKKKGLQAVKLTAPRFLESSLVKNPDFCSSHSTAEITPTISNSAAAGSGGDRNVGRKSIVP